MSFFFHFAFPTAFVCSIWLISIKPTLPLLGRSLGPMAAAAAAANLLGTAPNFISKRLLFKQTLTRTRTFVINGGSGIGSGNGNGTETVAVTGKGNGNGKGDWELLVAVAVAQPVAVKVAAARPSVACNIFLLKNERNMIRQKLQGIYTRTHTHTRIHVHTYVYF